MICDFILRNKDYYYYYYYYYYDRQTYRLLLKIICEHLHIYSSREVTMAT